MRQHPGGQRLGRGAGDDGHHSLVEYLAVVQLRGDTVHGGTGKLATLVNGPLVRVQPGEGGQQAGVDVDQPPVVMRHKPWCEDAHEPSQHHQRGVKTIDFGHQRRVKRLAAGKGFVVDHGSGQAMAAGKGQTGGIGLVAQHCGHAGTHALCPLALLGDAHKGLHVGAAARDQNDDVFHDLTECNDPPMNAAYSPALRPLSPAESRVLGTLMEKARTVPDSYPLSMQALLTGCNQKTTRDPVMNLTEGQVAEALDELKALALVVEQSGARVPRYSHNFQRVVGVPEQAAALLGLLMLRGPQTAGELRINSERWHRFADISSVDAFLEELQDRSTDKGGPLVVKLPRAPGTREQRWAHLLCGEVDLTQTPTGPTSSAATEDEVIALTRRVATLESEVASLQRTLAQLCEQLGVTPS